MIQIIMQAMLMVSLWGGGAYKMAGYDAALDFALTK